MKFLYPVSVDRLVDGHCNTLGCATGLPGTVCQSIAWSTGTATRKWNDRGECCQGVSRSLGRRALQPAAIFVSISNNSSVSRSLGRRALQRRHSSLLILGIAACQSIAWSTGTATWMKQSGSFRSIGSVSRSLGRRALQPAWTGGMAPATQTCQSIAWSTGTATRCSEHGASEYLYRVSRSLGRRALQLPSTCLVLSINRVSVDRLVDGHVTRQSIELEPVPLRVSVDRLVDGHCNDKTLKFFNCEHVCQSIAWSTGTATAVALAYAVPRRPRVSRSLGRRALQPNATRTTIWNTVCQSIAWSTGTPTSLENGQRTKAVEVSVDRLVDGHSNYYPAFHNLSLHTVSVDRLVDGHSNEPNKIPAVRYSLCQSIAWSTGTPTVFVIVLETQHLTCQSIAWSTGTPTR